MNEIDTSKMVVDEEWQKNHGKGKKDKDPLFSVTKTFFIIGTILFIITMMYFLLPLFSVVIGALLAMCIFLFMIVSVVFTLGLSLTNEGYRQWIGYHMMDVPNFFFNIAQNIAKLAPYFPVIAFPSIGIDLLVLILSIVGVNKKKKGFIPFIVFSSIFLVIMIIFTIIFYANGMQVMSTN